MYQVIRHQRNSLELLKFSQGKKKEPLKAPFLIMMEVRRLSCSVAFNGSTCFASMTNRHFAKTLQPQLTRATPKKC